MPILPPKPLSRARIWSCILINVAATPGLGSLIARRFFSGTCQLLLALTGCVLTLIWMFQSFYHLSMKEFGEPTSQRPSVWMGKWGLILFGIAWTWSLVTSIDLLFQFKKNEPASESNI